LVAAARVVEKVATRVEGAVARAKVVAARAVAERATVAVVGPRAVAEKAEEVVVLHWEGMVADWAVAREKVVVATEAVVGAPRWAGMARVVVLTASGNDTRMPIAAPRMESWQHSWGR